MTLSRFLENLWVRFRRRVIPINLEIQFNAPSGPKMNRYEALVPGEIICLVDGTDGKEYVTITVV